MGVDAVIRLAPWFILGLISAVSLVTDRPG